MLKFIARTVYVTIAGVFRQSANGLNGNDICLVKQITGIAPSPVDRCIYELEALADYPEKVIADLGHHYDYPDGATGHRLMGEQRVSELGQFCGMTADLFRDTQSERKLDDLKDAAIIGKELLRLSYAELLEIYADRAGCRRAIHSLGDEKTAPSATIKKSLEMIIEDMRQEALARLNMRRGGKPGRFSGPICKHYEKSDIYQSLEL